MPQNKSGATSPPARILSIAGSDSSGGAGIQADLKTITQLGGYGMSAITALTAQNTQGVCEVIAMPPAFVAKQITTTLDDIGADSIKIGMLHSTPIIEAVAESLASYKIPLIIDPVLIAKGGARLLADNALDALRTLVPRAFLLTPNLPEASALLAREIKTLDDMKHASDALRQQGATAVLLKGGHGQGDVVTDLLADAQGFTLFETPRIATRHTHGTGCTLSAAIACLLAQNIDVERACSRAIDYVHNAIATAPRFGSGHGPLNHMNGDKVATIVQTRRQNPAR